MLAGLIAALLGLGLVRTGARNQAHATLARQADLVAAGIDRAAANNSERQRRGDRRRRAPVSGRAHRPGAPKGDVTGDKQAVRAVTAQDIADLQAGKSVSTKITVDDRTILVEGRPLSNGGGIVLTRAVTDAVGPALALLNRQLVALAIGIVAAAIAGVLLARWVAAPLRRVADGARRLSAGAATSESRSRARRRWPRSPTR